MDYSADLIQNEDEEEEYIDKLIYNCKIGNYGFDEITKKL